MKRKTVILLFVLLLLFPLIAGCKSDTTANPAGSTYFKGEATALTTAAAGNNTETDNSAAAYMIVDSFSKFKTVFMYSYNLMNPITSTHADEHLTNADKAVQFMFTTVGLMLPIQVCPGSSSDLESELGIKDVSVTYDGQEFAISYTSADHSYNCKQTVKYDPDTDSLTSTACNYSLGITAHFEYVKTAGGYAVQSYMQNLGGAITVGKAFINNSSLLEFGLDVPNGPPAPIFGDTTQNFEIVKTCDVYCILDEEGLTIGEKTGASGTLEGIGA